ncbi:RNA-binding ribosome biosynthesis protein MAK21 [Aspergillus melleus]|uniref:RNA-binding ribosome biosynthesis protein MAK21 n=2 Tax=Aspergillus melleus TaxID=138277 RepID=UPI001E8ECCD3|nr:RNA-binding ribosome biosynthesis protein mak21 [Aspergillus melleus]KAH8425932.1 RNA-binding ribosome biosynthesis protein mak21 [Aspergillus melleus]
MAKNKGKRSSGANAIVPDGGVPINDSSAAGDAFPQLQEGAFAGLRQKIEQKLKDQNAAKEKKNNNAKPKPGAKDAPKQNNKPAAPTQAAKRGSDADKNNQGKKRDRNGDVIARGGKKDAEKPKPTKTDGADDNDTLRQEILALGGTEEDFDLLAEIESDSEVEGAKETPKKSNNKSDDDILRKELSSMLAVAGQVVPDDIPDEEAEAEDEDEEEEEDDEAEDNEMDVDEEEQSDLNEGPGGDVSSDEEASPPPTKKETKKQKANQDPVHSLPKEYSKLTVSPRSDWYNIELPPIPAKQVNALPRHLIDRVYQHALTLLEKESKMYSEAQQASASSSHKFYTTIMSSGTLSDKISALTLAVQESPVHNSKSLESLINLGKKRSRAQAVEVLRSLKDMFAQGTLLPSDRRLRSFANQPGLLTAFQGAGGRWSEGDALPGGLEESHLIVWAFESFLKDQYFEMLKILEVWCNDEIEFSRSRAVSYVYELLKEKPEQETNLLRLLVNKLGDKAKKIASRASYLLLQLEQAHPLMRMTIINSVEEVLFRPGQSQHAKYYAMITLNQTVLSLKEEQVAIKLLDIYFTFFVVLLKSFKPQKDKKKRHGKFGQKGGKEKEDAEKGQAQTEEMRDKLISGVLTGVNRAYPFTSSDTERLSKHIDTLFRITHSSNFNTSIQALMLIQQLTSTHQVAADRFYRTLYESLLDPRVATSSKQSLYLNLLFKALKNDVNPRRVKAFVKRIIQVLGLHQPAFICGVFYLIRELEKTFPGLQSLFDQPEENDSDDEEVFRDVPDEDDEQEEPVVAEATPQKPSNNYDPRKRDPEHSNADRTCLWELLPYLSHFHPSVSVNAEHLLDHKPMSGKPDMTIHTLTHFLDRFVYRTPKASAGVRGSSIMQPLAGSDAKDRLVSSGKHAHHLPLNSEAFWQKKSEDIAAEDVFFHEYFNRLGKDKEKAARKKKAQDSGKTGDDDDELSDAESEIWKALVDSRPEVEGGDSDDDLDMDDLESAYDKSDDEEASGDEGVIFNDESDDEDMDEDEPAAAKPKAQPKSKKAEEEFDEDDDFDMDVSDDEAFVGSDEEVELGTVDELPKDEKQAEKQKRRKLKHLPTFASADDYAALLADEDEGM